VAVARPARPKLLLASVALMATALLGCGQHPSRVTARHKPASRPAGAAHWASPLTLGPDAAYVEVHTPAFASDGRGVLAWTTAKGGPIECRNLGHPMARLAALDGQARPSSRGATPGEVVGRPMMVPRNLYAVLLLRPVGSDCVGVGSDTVARLDLAEGRLGARPTVRRLVGPVNVQSIAATASRDGEIALAWIGSDRVTLLRRLADGDIARAVSVPADDGEGVYPDVALAYLPDGRLLMAYPTAGKVRVLAFAPNGGHAIRRATPGVELGEVTIRLAAGADGRAVLAWTSQDGGEERDVPLQVWAVTMEPGEAPTGHTQLLDRGGAITDIEGTLAVGLAADGTATVGWSNASGRHQPIRVATAPPHRPFGPARVLARDGALDDLAVRSDGMTVAAWTEREGSWLKVAQRPTATGAFGRAVTLNPGDEYAQDPAVAFDASGRPWVAWSALTSPINGRARLAVVRAPSPDAGRRTGANRSLGHAGLVRRCTGAELRLSNGARLSAETGEIVRAFDLRNTGRTSCALAGYPGVRLLDHRGALPFAYRRGGRYWGTRAPPTTVILSPGRHAWFVVAKYRCDAGTLRIARTLAAYPPNTTTRRHVRFGVYPIFGYCRAYRGPNRDDPGNTVHVGPVHAGRHGV
jgi:hypothetical protein